MKITGLALLDAAITRHPLSTVSHKSPIQSCCEIDISMEHNEIVTALKQKDLLPVPYCVTLKIKSFLTQPYPPCDALYLHRINLPTGKTLCWVLLDKNGMLLEQAHSLTSGRYKNCCRSVIRHLLDKAPRQLALVA
jgi:hypothetical protein